MRPPDSSDEAEGRRYGVLICDDSEALREALREVIRLAPTHYVAGEAEDGAQAISEANRLRPDLILLDLAMPVLSGIEALPELRRIVPGARIIVFSGFAREVVLDTVTALGANAFIEKGSGMGAILDEIARAVPQGENAA